LGVRQDWLRDPELMAYNACWGLQYPGYDNETGCIDWPEAEWDAFLKVYQWDPALADYFYLHHLSADEFIGHVHYRVSPEDSAEIGINIVPKRRRQGWGTEALRLLIGQIWAATSVDRIVNDLEDSRVPAVRLHRAVGFTPGELAEFRGVRVRRWELLRSADA